MLITVTTTTLSGVVEEWGDYRLEVARKHFDNMLQWTDPALSARWGVEPYRSVEMTVTTN